MHNKGVIPSEVSQENETDVRNDSLALLSPKTE